MVIEPFKAPAGFMDEDSWYVEPASGPAFCVETDLSAAATGGAPAYSPLAWGGMDDDEYDSVEGWVVVTDLDGAGGEHIQGRLLAAYWQGRIWLKLIEGNAAPGGSGGVEKPDGAGFVGAAGVKGCTVRAPGRPVLPQVFICPMEARDRWLKTDGGQWRGDLNWEVVANFTYHPDSKVIAEKDDGSGAWGWKNYYRVTIWLIACGNVLVFYTTRSWALKEDLGEAAPCAKRCLWSAWTLPFLPAGATKEEREAFGESGGPWVPFYCALLPWEIEGREPVLLESGVTVVRAVGPVGTENLLRSEVLGVAPAAFNAPIGCCARFHPSGNMGGMFGAASLMYGWTVRPTIEEVTGFESWDKALRAFLVNKAESLKVYETAQDYRFDPVSIDAQGISLGTILGWHTPGEEMWPAVAPEYRILTEKRLKSPLGDLFLALAGSEVNGVLLTAGCFAEIAPEDAGDLELPEPPTPDTEPEPNPWDEPGVDDDEDDDGGNDGNPDEPDDDDGGNGGGGSVEWPLPEGYFYTAGAGVAIRRTSSKVYDKDGNVVNLVFGFDLDVVAEDLFWSTGVRYVAEVGLSTGNGGAYSYMGTACSMFYGFSAAAYDGAAAVLNWKSSFMHEDSDPKNCTVRVFVPGRVTAAAVFPQSGWCDSEALASSNILSFRWTGRKIKRSVGSLSRYFKVYSVTLKRGVLKAMALRRACEKIPSLEVSPTEATGTNSGPPDAPAVQAAVQRVLPAHPGDFSSAPAAVTGCMPAEFGADYESSGGGMASVSGGASWHYDPDNASASGSISAQFKVDVKEQSLEL